MRKIFKWIGIVLGGLVGLLALALIILFVVGGAKANKKYDIPGEAISIPTDAEAIQRGEHIATIYICKTATPRISAVSSHLLFQAW